MAHPLVYDPVEASRQRWIQQGWDDSASGMAAVVSVMRAEQIFLTRATAILRPLGLTNGQFSLLMALNRRSLEVQELAGFAQVMRKHATPVFLDGRNFLDSAEMESYGYRYSGVGR